MSALPLELIKGYRSIKVRMRENSVTKIYDLLSGKGHRERITVSLYHLTDATNFPCATNPGLYTSYRL